MATKKPAKKTFELKKASELDDIQYLPTGIPGLDDVIKGFPVKRITEIYGLEKVGKTTLTLMSLAALTRQKKRVIFIDVENSFNKQRADELGVNLDYLMVAHEFILEDVAQLILDYIGKAHAIVLDSLPALIPRREAEGEFGDANVGVKAKVINELQRRITPGLFKSNCAMIFINQLRPNMDPYGEKYITPGGFATRYAASLRLELKRNNSSDLIKKKIDGVDMQVGHNLHVTVKKTKTGSYEGKEIVFPLMYAEPIMAVKDEQKSGSDKLAARKSSAKQ